MTKKEQVFEALAKGHKKDRIMKDFEISAASYYNYNNLFKKEKEIKKANELAEHKIKKFVEESGVEGLKEVVEAKIEGPGRSAIIVTTVDIELKDGMILKNASIFKSNPQPGDSSIDSISEIEMLFKGINNSWSRGLISFQTEYINGSFHYSNVKDFKININEY
jgi:hypothetical protein